MQIYYNKRHLQSKLRLANEENAKSSMLQENRSFMCLMPDNMNKTMSTLADIIIIHDDSNE